jgi:Glyoxalase-like domain
MATMANACDADRQLPRGGEIFLDHVGHFVRDQAAASRALAQLGFLPTPPSVQVNPDPSGAETPTGTGNVTAMFRRGYVEALFKTADTALGRELDTAIGRYPGVHLAAFSVSDAGAAHRRLETSGFRVRPLRAMQRPVATPSGPDVAAFTLARVEPDEMAEGRIQILTHHTEKTVWQERWLDHPNGAVGLIDLVVTTADIEGTTARFARFLDRPANETTCGRVFKLDRGRVQIISPEVLARFAPGLAPPALPFIGLYAIAVKSLAALERCLHGATVLARSADAMLVRFPGELGIGGWMFVEQASSLPWRK